MIPKIFFVYSSIYDEQWRKMYQELHPKNKYPDKDEIQKYISQIENEWKKIGPKTLKEISNISGLKWHEDIKCYVVGRIKPFSNPLTIGLRNDKKEFMDVLVHELIHNILIQNMDKLKKYWQYLYKKYPNESLKTRIHIPVHAIHKEIYLKLFNKKRLERDIASCKDRKDYANAWNIVIQEEALINLKRTLSKR